jgi:hypothetical protein
MSEPVPIHIHPLQVLRRAHNHKTALDTRTHNVDHESDKVDKVYQ